MAEVAGQKNVPAVVPQTKEAVLLEMYRKIASYEIDSFAKLLAYVEKRFSKVDNAVLDEGFKLIRQLNWGAFYNLTKATYPKLWDELVLCDQKYRDFGDLKRNMNISEIYVGILDIHGYTAFCQKSKGNISLLHRLDQFLNNQIVTVAGKHGVLARRERGDEIVMIGAEADSMLAACFEVIRLFAKSKNIESEHKDVSSDFLLPAFEISAGITGGQSSTPLIITEAGELSGFLINCAARLQSRANTLAPKKTKVILEQHLVYKIKKQISPRFEILKDKRYFYMGEVAFKGVSLKSYEVISGLDEFYKLKIEPAFMELEQVIQGNHWQGKVLNSLCSLVMATAKEMPAFSETVKLGSRSVTVNNDLIYSGFREIMEKFNFNSFVIAFEKYEEMVALLKATECFDSLVKEYCLKIYSLYQKPLGLYKDIFEAFLRENKSKIFEETELRLHDGFLQLQNGFKRLMAKYHSSDKVANKTRLWLNAIENSKDSLGFEIYSGKQ